jgi:hypothetical protein
MNRHTSMPWSRFKRKGERQRANEVSTRRRHRARHVVCEDIVRHARWHCARVEFGHIVMGCRGAVLPLDASAFNGRLCGAATLAIGDVKLLSDNGGGSTREDAPS